MEKQPEFSNRDRTDVIAAHLNKHAGNNKKITIDRCELNITAFYDVKIDDTSLINKGDGVFFFKGSSKIYTHDSASNVVCKNVMVSFYGYAKFIKDSSNDEILNLISIEKIIF